MQVRKRPRAVWRIQERGLTAPTGVRSSDCLSVAERLIHLCRTVCEGVQSRDFEIAGGDPLRALRVFGYPSGATRLAFEARIPPGHATAPIITQASIRAPDAREGHKPEQAPDDFEDACHEAKPLPRPDLLEDRHHRRRSGELRGSSRDEGGHHQGTDDPVGNPFDSPRSACRC